MAIFDSGIFDTGIFDTDTGIVAVMAAKESGADTASFSISAHISATLAVRETGSDSANVSINVSIAATFAVREAGSDIFSGAGDSDGNIIVIPRDIEDGIIHLIEISGWDKQADEATTVYFADFAFTTEPTDSLPNTHFMERGKSPGSYERAMFSNGTTAGAISVGAGYIELVGNDGQLDKYRPENFAFDGYDLTIRTVPRRNPSYADAVVVFRGTVEQVEFSWTTAKVLIRDRLAELDVEHQEDRFAGTTISGGMDEAEGTVDDLKDRAKPLTYGRPLMAPGVAANRFDSIFAFGNDGLAAIEDVRDRGVVLTASGTDRANVAALRAATIASGYYDTCLAEGLIRTGSAPVGELTARPVEKSSAADRTAAQIAKRMLERKGFVEGVNFLADDIAALDELNDAEIGYFMPPEDATTLVSVQRVLGSIGATIVPDRLGVYRMFRLDDPAGSVFPALTITVAEALEVSGGRGIELRRTGDRGKGVPAWRVTTRYGYNWQVFNRNDLDVDTTEAFMAFASQEWREAIAEDETVKAVHKLASDLVYDTYLTQEADAQAEAARLLAMHSVARDRFLVPVKSYLAEAVELNSVVRMQLPRFGLDAGKSFRVIGITEDFKKRVTTLDLWG